MPEPQDRMGAGVPCLTLGLFLLVYAAHNASQEDKPLGRNPRSWPDVQGGGSEIDLIPAQVGQFGGAQAMPVGHKDHGGIAVAVTIAFGGFDKSLDFALREVLAGAQLAVGRPLGRNCSFYGKTPQRGVAH
jgi:hypothetical protein